MDCEYVGSLAATPMLNEVPVQGHEPILQSGAVGDHQIEDVERLHVQQSVPLYSI